MQSYPVIRYPFSHRMMAKRQAHIMRPLAFQLRIALAEIGGIGNIYIRIQVLDTRSADDRTVPDSQGTPFDGFGEGHTRNQIPIIPVEGRIHAPLLESAPGPDIFSTKGQETMYLGFRCLYHGCSLRKGDMLTVVQSIVAVLIPLPFSGGIHRLQRQQILVGTVKIPGLEDEPRWNGQDG